MLPAANSFRWQPLRSGLVNLFKYQDEVFQFEHGRMLLRGNNGTGKSRILALQLPFLLDGEIHSKRVEPDGDPAKRMEWNLLMGGLYDNRLGYTWIEFARVDEDGVEHYLTLACGLHARKGMDLKRWFLVTPLRIGRDLEFVQNGIPLSRDRLEAAIAGQGQVFQQAREYRVAVDEKLFQLRERYEPLIELLIRLRQPQLSRRLDEAVLSSALSEALRPLAADLVDDVADSFRSLEEDRAALEDFERAHRDVGDFLKAYRHYASIVTRRHAKVVRDEHNAYDDKARSVKRLSEERQNLTARLGELTEELDRAEQSFRALDAEERALRDSPEMKSADRIAQVKQVRDDLERSAEVAARDTAKASGRHEQDAAEFQVSESAFRQRQEAQQTALAALQEAGARAAFPIDSAPRKAEVDDRLQGRGQAIRQLHQRNAQVAEAARNRDAAAGKLSREQNELEAARAAEAEARDELAVAIDRFTADAFTWEAAAVELKLQDAPDWKEATLEWLPDRTAVHPFQRAVEDAYGLAQTSLLEQREQRAGRVRETETTREETLAELAALVDGRQPEPPAPPHRAAGTRDQRPGAPFWKLCAFHESIPAPDRAGYEAALQASGILDAWLLPDGALRDAVTGDIFISAPADAPEDQGLNRVLRLESDTVEAGMVRRVLSRIGAQAGEGETWVAPDGHWRNGPLQGDWSKAEAEFLGFEARERARLLRIQQLEARRDELQRVLDQLRGELDKLERRLATLKAEKENAPDLNGIRAAATTLEIKEQAVARLAPLVLELERLAQEAREAWEASRQTRDRDAEDLGLYPWREEEPLDALRDLMQAVRDLAGEYWTRERASSDAAQALDQARNRVAQAAERLAEQQARQAEVDRRFAEASSEYAVLRESIGKTADEVLARWEETKRSISRAETLRQELRREKGENEVQVQVKATQIQHAEAARAESLARRDAAIQDVRSLAENRFLAEADPSLQPGPEPLSSTKAVELARLAEQTLGSISAEEADWNRAQNELHTQYTSLSEQLTPRNYAPRIETICHSVLLVKCQFGGQDHNISSLHALIQEEMESRSKILEEEERKVIENHLIGDVAKELQERIREGETWVSNVNQELERRPTSSGIKLRFDWHIDAEGPAGLPEANRLFLRAAATWSPEERDAIGQFLQSCIQKERAENPEASWKEHLTRALDYRTWRRFDVERSQDGRWQRLTKRTHGTGSGGEKAMTLTVPQFAAASAHYQSASPIAPRLILLDEVFVGIDGETRAKLMGLLDTFDLDYVMTSEREWGCYATVSRLAIYQLASRPDYNAVFATRWVWNGKECVRG